MVDSMTSTWNDGSTIHMSLRQWNKWPQKVRHDSQNIHQFWVIGDGLKHVLQVLTSEDLSKEDHFWTTCASLTYNVRICKSGVTSKLHGGVFSCSNSLILAPETSLARLESELLRKTLWQQWHIYRSGGDKDSHNRRFGRILDFLAHYCVHGIPHEVEFTVRPVFNVPNVQFNHV